MQVNLSRGKKHDPKRNVHLYGLGLSFLTKKMNGRSCSSVIVQVSFQRFLNLGTPFLGNITNLHVGTVETYKNLRNLQEEKNLCTSRGEIVIEVDTLTRCSLVKK